MHGLSDHCDYALGSNMSAKYAMAWLMTPGGGDWCLTDLFVARATTRKQSPPRHVLAELRIAALEAAVRRRRL